MCGLLSLKLSVDQSSRSCDLIDYGKLTSNTLLLFFRINTLLHILHIRLSFGIVHSIVIYSTISKITVRPREIGTGGTEVTSNHDNESHRDSDSVFYSLGRSLVSFA